MIWLAKFTQYIFCIISMMLTSLFALSLSGITESDYQQSNNILSPVFLAIIFIGVGSSIDIGKYLFWLKKSQSIFFLILSLMLMFFSWLASCAFLLSSELSLLDNAKYQTAEYVEAQQEVENLIDQIAKQEILLSNRLNSAYHSEWQKSEVTAKELAALKATLAEKRVALSSFNTELAFSEVATTRFFYSLGGVFDSSPELFRLVSYGLLSFLLEISTLGMISLVKSLGEGIDQDDQAAMLQGDKEIYESKEQRDIAVTLINDILNGRTAPTIRKIKLTYKLDFRIIQDVMRNLYKVGILCDDKRNSYKLNPVLMANEKQKRAAK